MSGDAETTRTLFAAAPQGTLRGESTPFYLYSHDAQRRIRELVPQARLIVVLRDPIERAHSNWTHLWSAGLDPIDDFVRACAAEDQRVAAGWAEFWHYKRLGLYGQQVEHLYSVFPREQVLVFRYRELVEDPPATLDRICGFLGVSQGVIDHVPRENVTAHPELTPRHRAVSRIMRAGSAVTSRLPGHPGKVMLDRLESTPAGGRGAAAAADLGGEAGADPVLRGRHPLLGDLTGVDYSNWLRPREDAGGLVGARPSGQRQARNGRPRDY